MVSRKVETKVNVTLSPVGAFSGISGRQKETHVCISPRLNAPFSVSILYGLYNR